MLQSHTLHDKKVRIVDIQLHRVEKILHLARGRISPINQILALPPDEDLTCYINFLALFISHRTPGLVLIIKYNSDAGLVHTRLTLLVNELG